MQSFALPLAALSLAAPVCALGSTKEIDRSHIDDSTSGNWAISMPRPGLGQSKAALGKKVAAFERHRGHLGDGPKALADALVDLGTLQNELQRIAVYAHARSDENTRLAARAPCAPKPIRSASSSTRSPPAASELLTLPDRPFRRRGPGQAAARMAFYLRDVLRWKPHTLAAEEERIVAMAGELSIAPSTVYGVLKTPTCPTRRHAFDRRGSSADRRGFRARVPRATGPTG